MASYQTRPDPAAAAAQNGTGKAAIYCRVSTAAQEDGSSLQTQEASCRQFAADHGLTPVETQVHLEVYSGAELFDRPRLNELRAAVRAREIDAIVIHAIDRLSRDPIHLGLIVMEAEHAGVAVHFVTEPLDSSPEGQLIRYVRGYAGQVEREKIRERQLRGKRARIMSGKVPNFGFDLYGYRRDRETGRREVYEPDAAVVRDIFRWVAVEHCSIKSVIRRLNTTGVPAPSSGKLRRRAGWDGPPHWGNGAVYRILTEPAYKGETILWRRQRVGTRGRWTYRPESEWLRLPDGTTPAIVSADLWETVQRRLATNTGEQGRNEARPYLLRGLIYCAVCGRKMRSCPERNRRVYRCASRETPAGPCGGKRIPADDCEAWLWAEVTKRLTNPELIDAEVKRRRAEGPDPALAATIDTARRALAKIERQQERLIARFSAGDDDSGFPWELVEREIAKLQREKEQVQATIADAERRLQDAGAAADRLDALADYCRRVSVNLDRLDFNGRRLALEALAIKVTANGRNWDVDGLIDVFGADSAAGNVSSTYLRAVQPARIPFHFSTAPELAAD